MGDAEHYIGVGRYDRLNDSKQTANGVKLFTNSVQKLNKEIW